jgi:hypothetical protein
VTSGDSCLDRLARGGQLYPPAFWRDAIDPLSRERTFGCTVGELTYVPAVNGDEVTVQRATTAARRE